MSQKISDIIIANDESIVKLLDIPQITLGITVTEAFYRALRSPTPDCALMLKRQGAIPNSTRMIDMMLEIEYDEIHIIKNIIICGELFIIFCNRDDRAILFEFITKLSCGDKKYHDIIELLINMGIDINKNEITPLHLLCTLGELELINMLIRKNVDLNKKNNRGQTALICSIYADKNDSALLLIESGADLNSQMDNGNTALMVAVQMKMKKVTIALINNNVNTSIINNKFQTALDIARNCHNRDENIVQILTMHTSTKKILVDGNILSGVTNILLAMLLIAFMITNLYK